MCGSRAKWFLEMDHGIGPPEGRWRQAPDIGGIPDDGRGAEDGGKFGEQARAGDGAVPWRCLDSICHSVASANQEAIWTM